MSKTKSDKKSISRNIFREGDIQITGLYNGFATEVESKKEDEIMDKHNRTIIKKWTREREWFLKKLQEIIEDENQLVGVLTLMDNTCHFCWNQELPCPCWDDE